MNRIEKILEEVEKRLAMYPEHEFLVRSYGQQVKFFKWLLEEVEELPVYELHEPRVSPTVWGMGDVSYHVSIQLQKIKTPSSPVVLIFDYKAPEETQE